MFGREVPAIIGRIHRYDAKRRDGSAHGNIFGTNSAGGGSVAAAGGISTLPRSAAAFAAASTLIGTCLVLAATAVFTVNTQDVVTFAILDGLGVLITYLGVLVCRGQLEWIDIMAARGILPMGILLGLLGFLGIYS